MLGCYAADKDGNRAAEPELISHYAKDQLEAAGWCYVVAISSDTASAAVLEAVSGKCELQTKRSAGEENVDAQLWQWTKRGQLVNKADGHALTSGSGSTASQSSSSSSASPLASAAADRSKVIDTVVSILDQGWTTYEGYTR